jgi:hypothetical protein
VVFRGAEQLEGVRDAVEADPSRDHGRDVEGPLGQGAQTQQHTAAQGRN